MPDMDTAIDMDIETDTGTNLNKMLDAANLPVKASYTRAEVCSILGVSPRTFWSMVCLFEPLPEHGQVHPSTLDSFMLRGHRRVPYHELVSFLKRNRTYDRVHAEDPRQMSIPGF